MSVDRILDLIDAGLAEVPAPVYGRSDVCGRCGKHPADGEMCIGCRAFVLGDSDADPGARDITAERFDQLRRQSITVTVTADTEALMQSVVDVINEAVGRPGVRDLLDELVANDVLAERVRLRAEQCMPRDTGLLLFRGITANS